LVWPECWREGISAYKAASRRMKQPREGVWAMEEAEWDKVWIREEKRV
jgi:hypothetical protein